MDQKCPRCSKKTSAVCMDCGEVIRDIICYKCYGTKRACAKCKARIIEIPKDALFQK